MNKIKYANYTQISPERDVTANGFSKGQINFKMNMDSMSRWNPYFSYIRMRVRLSKANDNALDLKDGIAPGMFQGDTFWQQQNIQCNGVKVSEIDDYVSQVSALKQRYAVPETRRKEFLSKTNFAQAYVHQRINQVSVDGTDQEDPIEEAEKPGNLASTVALSREELTDGVALGFDGVLGDYALANTGIMTFTANAGAVPVGNVNFVVGDVVQFEGNNAAVIRMIVRATAVATITLTASGGGDIEIVAATVGTAVNFFRIRSGTDYDNLVGVNTTFNADLVIGDILLIDGRKRVSVISITDNLNAKVDNNDEVIAATDDWLRIRQRQSRRVKDYELCYRPCLGLFSINEWMGGNWKLELTPHTNLRFQRYAIESLIDKVPDVDYKLEVIDLQLYVYKGMASSPKNGMMSYDFTEIRCQAQTITSASLLNKAFVVNNNSHTFSIAYQKPDAGDRTDFSKTKFRMLNDYEKRITRYQLRIAGETQPTPLPQIDTDPANNRDFATQQYYEGQHYLGSIYLDEPEGLTEWFERGPYYSYVLPKKLNSGANRLYVSQEFAIAPPESFLLLVFDHYYKSFQLQYENGIVKKCIRGTMVN